MVDQLSWLAKVKNLSLKLELNPDLRSQREGDEQKIRQILVNLIGNTIKFTTAGRVTVSVASLDPERVQLEVIDNGIGIDEDQRELKPFLGLKKVLTVAMMAPV